MAVRIVPDPIDNPLWAELLDRHPAASIFHTPGWLETLRQTYGYEPFVMTTSPAGAIEAGLVACEVKGWTSRRLVSLPFSDHCDPLMANAAELPEVVSFLVDHMRRRGMSAAEVRPTAAAAALVAGSNPAALLPGPTYCFHHVDLRDGEAEIFKRFHPSSTQRAIRRAEREGLTYECGSSDRLLETFYRLVRMTRRRHRLPPQPVAWFRNLVANLGGRVSIHVASKNAHAVASMLTLSFKSTTYYKYGASDAAHHRLGGMPFLFWRMMQGAVQRGATRLDLGRSDVEQAGLIAFKNHLGATPSTLTYYCHPAPAATAASSTWMTRAARTAFAYLPDTALDLAGSLIYKRLG